MSASYKVFAFLVDCFSLHVTCKSKELVDFEQHLQECNRRWPSFESTYDSHRLVLCPQELRIKWLGLSPFSPSSCDGKRRCVCFIQELSVRVMLPLSHAVFLRTWGGWEIRMRQESFWVVPHSPASWSSDKVGAKAKRLVRHFVFMLPVQDQTALLNAARIHRLWSVWRSLIWFADIFGVFSQWICVLKLGICEKTYPLWMQIKLHLIAWLWTGVDSSKISKTWLTWICRMTRIYLL